jgi:hypothetical protein
MSSLPAYKGASTYLRWFPKALLALALGVLVSRWNHSIQFATLLALVAYIHERWLAWQFFVADDGITLRFPFGRRAFLSKDSVTIRIDMVGAFALGGRRRRFGYPLFDGILYQPGHEDALRLIFQEHGYDVR